MNNLHRFIDFLKNLDSSQLPGLDSHLKMAPKFKEKSFRDLTPTDDARMSAVLIPIIPYNNSFKILFTLRSEKLKKHSGQISFPGGRMDSGETPEETALRETHEEIGVPKEKIKIIKNLSNLYVPPSKSLISPIVGLINEPFDLTLSEFEVDEVFYVSIESFIDSKNHKISRNLLDGFKVDVPYWDVHHSTKLWGATAMILSEFIDIYHLFVNGA